MRRTLVIFMGISLPVVLGIFAMLSVTGNNSGNNAPDNAGFVPQALAQQQGDMQVVVMQCSQGETDEESLAVLRLSSTETLDDVDAGTECSEALATLMSDDYEVHESSSGLVYTLTRPDGDGEDNGTPTGTPDDTPTGTPDDTPTGTPDDTPTGTPDDTPTGTPDDD